MNSTQRPATGIGIFYDVSEGRISILRPDDGDSLRDRSSGLQCAFQQRLTAERKQRLVGAHSRAAATCQDKYGHAVHDSMIPDERTLFAIRYSLFARVATMPADPKSSPPLEHLAEATKCIGCIFSQPRPLAKSEEREAKGEERPTHARE